jgi:hypothetical protein
MAKYDVLDKFIDSAGKYRLLVENLSLEDLLNLKFDHDPSNEEIVQTIDEYNDNNIV